MAVVALLTVAVLAVLLASLVEQLRSRLPGVPGPREVPWLKNIPAIVPRSLGGTLYEYFLEQTRKHGHFWQMAMPGGPRTVLVTHPGDVEYLLKTKFDSFEKGPNFRARMRELLGDGIFNADGELWYSQRKTAVHLFSVRQFRDFGLTAFLDHGRVLCDRWRASAKSKTPFDIQDLFYRYTMDSIGTIGFAQDFHCLTKPRVPFAEAFDYSQKVVGDRFALPFFRLRRLLSPQEWRLRRAIREMDVETYRIIDERLALPAEELEKKHDFLSLFLRVTSDQDPKQRRVFLRDVVLNFLIAGRDTTAGALTWSVLELTRHPAIAARLADEIDNDLREAGETPFSVSYETLTKKLELLDAFVHEVLRLHPSVPKDAKEAVKDETFPSGLQVPKGTAVVYLPWVMGRLESIWGPDAAEFRPERFMGQRKPSQFEFIAFNAGPRLCLGMNLALLEMKTALVLLLSHFRVRLVPKPEEVRYLMTLTMPVRDGLEVVLEERESTLS